MAPASPLVMLVAPSGEHLAAPSASAPLELRAHCDDDCMWQRVPGEPLLRCLTSGCELRAAAAAAAGGVAAVDAPEVLELNRAGHLLAADGSAAGSSAGRSVAAFTAVQGPRRRPSEYLAELEGQGYTILDGVLPPEAIAELKRVVQEVRDKELAHRGRFDERLGLPSLLHRTPVVARAAANPVALYLMRSYLGEERLQYCHPPSVTVLRPARKLLEKPYRGGWHSDYPYPPSASALGHGSKEHFAKLDATLGKAGLPSWKDRRARLGVQFNICVDEFRAENGATQFILGSHRSADAVPAALNATVTRAGEGPHREAVQLRAEAGAALIYDSRMYHRACPELNVSGQDRLAILNATCPAFVWPKHPSADATSAHIAAVEDFVRSDVPKQLTAREVREVVTMVGETSDLRARL